jgi:O-antigen/teichoic acid export membrane protein
MHKLLRDLGAANRAIVGNASSLVGTTAVTSVLGFAYWWLAAHQFPPAAVGVAAAGISAMTLLGNLGTLGIGTLLMGELPRQPERTGTLITTGLLLAGTTALVIGAVFAVLAPHMSPDFAPLAPSVAGAAVFVVGVALAAVTLVLDQALIGLLRGELQLGRNAVFAVAKLAALVPAALWLADGGGLIIYGTWAAGSLVSLLTLAGFARGARGTRRLAWPDLGTLRRAGRLALGHHGLNLALQAPSLVLPLVVTALLSATTTASYYVAAMLGQFVFIVPLALTTTLYAVGAASPAALPHRVRFTLRLALLAGLAANAVVMVAADYMLGLFGHSYAEAAGWSLRVLVLAVFPLTIKDHYVALCRVHRRVGRAAFFIGFGAALEVILAAAGAAIGDLLGLSIGWLTAVCLEAVFMVRAVLRASHLVEQTAHVRPAEAILPTGGS